MEKITLETPNKSREIYEKNKRGAINSIISELLFLDIENNVLRVSSEELNEQTVHILNDVTRYDNIQTFIFDLLYYGKVNINGFAQYSVDSTLWNDKELAKSTVSEYILIYISDVINFYMKDSIDLTIWDKIKQFFNFELNLSKYYNYVITFNDRKTIVEDYKELEKNTSRNISSQYQKQLESEERQRKQDLKLMKVIDEKNALEKKLKASENSGK